MIINIDDCYQFLLYLLILIINRLVPDIRRGENDITPNIEESVQPYMMLFLIARG